MKKEEARKILFSMRNPENEAIINNVLGKIDMMPEDVFECKCKDMAETEIREYIKKQINIRTTNEDSNHININKFFEYGIAGNCVHLHLPGDFHEMFEKLGKIKASAIIARYLIDAITRINNQKNMGDSKLENCSSIYMISPIFYSPTFYPKALRSKKVRDNVKIETPIFKLFKLMGLETKTYIKEDLQNPKFVENNEEAKLAVKNFGTKMDVGTASLSFKKLNSKRFQTRLNKISEMLEKIGEPIKQEMQL